MDSQYIYPESGGSSSNDFDYAEKDIDEDLICSICLNPFVDPISHNSCGNTFCSKCVENVKTCPICRNKNFKKNCSPSVKTIRNLLDKLKVKCSMCKNIVQRGELKDHQEKYCPLHDAYKQVGQLKLKLEEEFKEKVSTVEKEQHEMILNIQSERERIMKEAQIEIAKKQEIMMKLHKQKEDMLAEKIKSFENQVLKREIFEASYKPIHLNVRGTIMTVSLGDFIYNERESDNLFKKMFNGQHPLHQTPSKQFDDPIHFINCDPIAFKHILDWLRFGFIATNLDSDMHQLLINESKQLGLTNLVLTLTHYTLPKENESVNSNVLTSKIINDKSISSTLILQTKSKSAPQLLYRGTRDGFGAIDFHSKCDNQGATLTIIKSEQNQIFGGFTTKSWQSPEHPAWVSDSLAFIFKIIPPTGGKSEYQLFKHNILQHMKKSAIQNDSDCLAIFGSGCDLHIENGCNSNYESSSYFGESYELPKNIKYESNDAQSYLAGSNVFKVIEIEVFKINK